MQKASETKNVVYIPHPGVTAESEAKILAAVYQFVLECAKKSRAAAQTAPDTKGKLENDFRVKTSIQG